jgi:hypothetical protein
VARRAQPADSLEIYKDDEYIIGDRDLLVNRCETQGNARCHCLWLSSPLTRILLRLCSFVSVPRDLGSLNCGAFCAGVVRGVLEAAGFPATVSAYSAPVEGQGTRTNVLMKFAPEVLARETRLG